MWKLQKALCFLLLVIFDHLYAEELSLEQIYLIARDTVESVQLQDLQVKLSQENLKRLESNFYPKIFFHVDYTRLDTSNITTGSSGVSGFYDPNQYAVKFGAKLPGIQVWREYFGHKAAKLDIEEKKQVVEQARRELYAHISQVYYNALAAEQDLVNVQAYYNATVTQGKNIGALAKLGRINPSDRLTQDANIANARAAVVKAKANVRLAHNALRVEAGLPNDAIPKPDRNDLPKYLDDRQRYIEAIDSRPEIKTLLTRVKSKKALIKVAQGGFGPTLDLFGNVYVARSGFLSGALYDVGLAFDFPLFDGLSAASDVRIAKANLRTAELQIAQAKRTAATEIQNAYDQALLAIEPLAVLKQAVKAAEKDYKQRTVDYKRKLITNLELNQSLSLMINAQRSYDQSLYTGKAAIQALNAAIGNIP